MITVVSMLCAPLLVIKLLWTFIGVKTMEEPYHRFELEVNPAICDAMSYKILFIDLINVDVDVRARFAPFHRTRDI